MPLGGWEALQPLRSAASWEMRPLQGLTGRWWRQPPTLGRSITFVISSSLMAISSGKSGGVEFFESRSGALGPRRGSGSPAEPGRAWHERHIRCAASGLRSNPTGGTSSRSLEASAPYRLRFFLRVGGAHKSPPSAQGRLARAERLREATPPRAFAFRHLYSSQRWAKDCR